MTIEEIKTMPVHNWAIYILKRRLVENHLHQAGVLCDCDYEELATRIVLELEGQPSIEPPKQ